MALFDSFYRAGALVFGGGHVVLPLLQASVVPQGWVSNDDFLAGYGAAQAVPGPLFTFSAYLGTVMALPPNGWPAALVPRRDLPAVLPAGPRRAAVVERAAPAAWAQSALSGINAAVVGLLLAALYDPVWTSAIPAGRFRAGDRRLDAADGVEVPPWLVVAVMAAAGALMAAAGY